jgi:beta-phosphoglucomutase-like phosphatase (HAD superfamily)
MPSIDGPAGGAHSDHGLLQLPVDREKNGNARLRYAASPQAALMRRVRQRPRRAVILGLEGVLVDTREATTLSWLVALHDGGHDTAIDLLRHLSGVSPAEMLRIVTGLSAGSPEGAAIVRQQERIFRMWYLPRILPFVGARRLLQRMKNDGLRLVALSSGTSEMLPDLVRASGVADLLHDIVATDDESRDGSLNEIVTSVMARCDCSREQIVFLGDSPYDVASGERCGIDVVALRCGGWTDATLQGALAVYDHHIHLLSQYPASPFAGGDHAAVPQHRLARLQ